VDVDLRGGDWLDDNRSNWDERVPVHVASDFYDREPLRRGDGLLDPIARAGIERMHPEGLDGVRVLHLQCHFGSDTLSLANLGASVVGLDFSRAAVEEARRMAAEIGVADRARFVEANIYDARRILPEPGSFDLVFTTWGTIGWLPDVAEWARIIAWFLKPGGRLYFADGTRPRSSSTVPTAPADFRRFSTRTRIPSPTCSRTRGTTPTRPQA
jgi:SAM-dependent methyltransferase